MKQPNLRQIIILFFFIFLILLITSLLVVRKENKKKQFYKKITYISKCLNYLDYSKAEKSLNEINVGELDIKSCLIFLKRSYNLSKKTGNYQILYNHCLKIKKRHLKKIEIQAIVNFASGMCGRHNEKIFNYSKKYKTSKYSKIYEFSLLNLGEKDPDIKGNYKDIINDKVTIKTLNELFEIERDNRYLVDIALLYLKNNDFKNASKTINKTPDRMYQRLKMYINYSAENYNDAEKYFLQIEDRLNFINDSKEYLIGCDIFLKKHDYYSAEKRYKNMIEAYYEAPIIYRNLYSINNTEKETWLEKGISKYKNVNMLLIPKLKNAINDNKTEEIKQIKASMPYDETGLSSLLFLKEEMTNKKIEHIIAEYWNIINNYNYSEVVAHDFIYYLMLNKRNSELLLFLNRCKKDDKYKSWMEIYYSVLLLLRNEPEKALETIENNEITFDTLEKCYNYAVIQFFLGNYKKANDYLDKSVILIDDTTPEYDISRIYYKKAEIFNNLNDLENARYNIRIADDYNSKNDYRINNLYRELIKE